MSDDVSSSDPSPPNSTPNDRIAANIQAALDAQKVTYRELASRLGVHESTVGRIAGGDVTISYAHVENIAAALGLKPDQLVTGNLEHSCTEGHS